MGFRADVRYFRAFNTSTTTIPVNTASSIAESVLPGLDFWRANIGLAFRW